MPQAQRRPRTAHSCPLFVDGKLEDRWFGFTASPTLGEGGQVEGVFNIATEATDRVRAKRARLQSERRLKRVIGQAGLSADIRALFEAAPTPLLVLAAPDWTIEAVNDARLRVIGSTRESLLGRKHFEGCPDDPDDPQTDGVRNLSASIERVLAMKTTNVMAVQRHAVRDHSSHFVEPWSMRVDTVTRASSAAGGTCKLMALSLTDTGSGIPPEHLARIVDAVHHHEGVVNAQEALTYLKEHDGHIPVVLTDVVMRGMSGVELGEEVRRRYPDLPVILTSGYSHVLAEEGQHGFELLKKPYAADDLPRALRRVSLGRDA
ncbi:response regulator [Rubellimicrobium rubrum]|uniref:response regulator n=1 Tax=Rubellimicrobium rubrum TaxID=2585369 RepID=UPI001C3F3B53|nr:response regulator [Rubellimicrobium rubrum]